MTGSEVTPSDRSRGVAFWAAVAGGWAMIAFGVRGLVGDGVDLIGFARWFVGIAVLHDAFVAPLVFGVAWLVGRVLPRTSVIPVRVGLATSALLIVYAWPLVRGWGRTASNPTALPLDYRRNLVLSLAAVWTGVALWIVVAAARHVAASRPNPEGPPPT